MSGYRFTNRAAIQQAEHELAQAALKAEQYCEHGKWSVRLTFGFEADRERFIAAIKSIVTLRDKP